MSNTPSPSKSEIARALLPTLETKTARAFPSFFSESRKQYASSSDWISESKSFS